MTKHPQRGWLRSLVARRRPAPISRQPAPVRLAVERFEDRDVPSVSIPLNGTTWTPIGPSPIAVGQGPGNLPSSGRLNGVAVSQGDPNVIYVAADGGGIWRTTDGGRTWSARTDQQEVVMQTIAAVNRVGGDTVYAFSQDGRLFTSTDGATTFTETAPFPIGSVVNKLVVIPVDSTNQNQDILYAAVGSNLFLPVSDTGGFPGSITGSGIWRSTDGGQTWTNIVDPTAAAFGTVQDNLSFTDVVADPNNSNILYAAIGNTDGSPHNGVYRTSNALSANPTWTLLIGGSAFFPGSTPGNIKLAISPVLPSEIFASVALRTDPRTGAVPLLGVFRTLNSGVDWTPVLVANPLNQVNDPNNYMSIFGEDNNVILIAPSSPTNPLQQTVYVAGFTNSGNGAGSNSVMVSTDSGTSWTPIGTDASGVGTYPNIHQGVFDSQGRILFATGGGVFRLDSSNPVVWESLNGAVGPNGLGVVQMNGFALNPTNPNQAIGNIANVSSQANIGVEIHNAAFFNDTGNGVGAYGWQSVDSNNIDGQVGSGQVIYNPFNPNIVYRVTNGSNVETDFIRRSDDGGLTWTAAAGGGFQGYPFQGGFYVPPLAIDPSQPNRLFSGYTRVQETDDNGNTWREAIQVSTTGTTVAIPGVPTSVITSNGGGPIGLTTIGVGRETGVAVQGFFPINGEALFVGTETDVALDQNGNPRDAAIDGPQLWMNVIPTNTLPWPPPNTSFGVRSWAKITPPTSASFFAQSIDQVLVDPTNNSTLYVFMRGFDTNTGQSGIRVFRGTNLNFFFTVVNNTIVGNGSANWTDITGNLPTGLITADRPQDLALDPHTLTDPTDDVLYAGTPRGVWKLSNPGGNASPVWQEVGVTTDPNTGITTRSMPPVPVHALSLNTTTGILGAATYGRGAFEIQIRGQISGHIFTDVNGNGVFDAGDTGFAGVTVQLLDQNAGGAPVAVTTTDANGFYSFTSVRAGNYTISATAPAGAIRTTALPAALSNFTETTTAVADFGFFQSTSISGFKYLDANANGTKDAGEQGLALFTIYIDSNNNGVLDAGERSTVTAGDGSYSFTNLGPAVINGQPNPLTFNGAYILREVQRPGFTATVPAAGQANVVILKSGQPQAANFGNIRSSSGGGGAAPVVVTAEDAGGAPVVAVRDLTTGQVVLQFFAYNPAFRGGVRVATGDFNGDKVPDIVTAAGPGGGPHIRVFDGVTGNVIREFMAYSPSFTGGVYVAVGDVNHDGTPDIITGAGAGGGPHVKVFDGKTGAVIKSFFAYAPTFAGGVRVASGDIDGDGFSDIITGAGLGGGPHVAVYSGLTGGLIRSFFAYTPAFKGGIFVAAGDVNGDGQVDIITGPGDGGGPHLRVFDGATNGNVLEETMAFNPGHPSSGGQLITSSGTFSSGLRVAAVDLNQDGAADIVVAPGRGSIPIIRVLDGKTLNGLLQPDVQVAFDPGFLGGVFVAGT